MMPGTKFQFTHPGRGATGRGLATRRGDRGFNSRTPGGVRLLRVCLRTTNVSFQFTHPGRGATAGARAQRDRPRVSIHAPREGCDTTQGNTLCLTKRFNSRTPGGVRLGLSFSEEVDYKFQFTHPGRGATPRQKRQEHLARGSIHAPREGCDTNPMTAKEREDKFQFTHPGRGATAKRSNPHCELTSFNSRTPGGVRPRRRAMATGRRVSIHAPREGCD